MPNVNDYTKRHRIQKSIELKLEPYGKTNETIEKECLLEQDKALYERIEAVKPVVDAWIIDIINKAVNRFDFDFQNLYYLKTGKRDLKEAENGLDSGNDPMEEDATKDLEVEENAFIEQLMAAVDNAVEQSTNGTMRKLSDITSQAAAFLKTVLPNFVKNAKSLPMDRADAILAVEAVQDCRALMTKFLRTRETAVEANLPKREMENFDRYCSFIPAIRKVLDNRKVPEIKAFLDENPELESFALPSFFSMLLTEDGIEGYNRVICGVHNEKKIVSKGLNNVLSELNVKNKADKGYHGIYYTIVKKGLYKLPLVPRERQYSFAPIEDDKSCAELVKSVMESTKDVRRDMIALLVKQTSKEGLTVFGRDVHTASHLATADHNMIPAELERRYCSKIEAKYAGKKLPKTAQKQIDKAAETVRKGSYLLTDLEEIAGKDILSLIKSQLMTTNLALNGIDLDESGKIKGNRKAEALLQKFYDILGEFKATAAILSDRNAEDADVLFFNDWGSLVEELNDAMRTKAKVLGYITRKPADIVRDKQALFGTVSRPESQWWHKGSKFDLRNHSIIEIDGKYYYFILVPGTKPFEVLPSENGENVRMYSVRKGAQGIMGDIPKRIKFLCKNYFEIHPEADSLMITEGYSPALTITRRQWEIYKTKSFAAPKTKKAKEAETEAQKATRINDLHEYIQLFMNIMTQCDAMKIYDFSSLPAPETYQNLPTFCEDAEAHYFYPSWELIDRAVIEDMVDSGKALMFLVTNRVMYTDKAQKNSYVSIFLNALSDANISSPDIQLGSRPVIKYRPAVFENAPVHHKGSWLVGKVDLDGNPIEPDVYEEIYKFKNGMLGRLANKKAQELMDSGKVSMRKADYDIEKYRRYKAERYAIQFSYIKNFKAPDNARDFLNEDIRETAPERNIITVVRGTEDLVYYVATDFNGNVLEKKSLNVINGFDYMKKLKTLSKDRREEKKAWVNETTVKDIKEAYIGFAITEIVKAAVKYNAVIVVEALNQQFKDKFSCIDNQVFEKFEKALATRLSDLFFRDTVSGAPGSVSNPLQLADNTGSNYQDGILFLTNGAYTNTMDETTGFQNFFRFGKVRSVADKKEFLGKFDSIVPKKDKIEVKFDYRNFRNDAPGKQEWTINITGGCAEFDREHKCYKEVKSMPEAFLGLLEANGHQLEGKNIVADVEKLSGKELDCLLKYIRIASGGGRKMDTDSRIYVSPVTGQSYHISDHAAEMLRRKYTFNLTTEIKKKEDYTKKWVEMQQNA